MKPLLITLFIFISGTLLAQTTQESIDSAMGKCFESGSVTPLQENYTTLESDYWRAYNLYLQTAFHMNTGKEYGASIDKGITLLSGVKEKNSEDYALLASLQSMKMSTLTAVQDLMDADNAFTQYSEQAIKLDPTNPRAYYVAGVYDLYKPAVYGGGTKAESLLKKALDLYASYEGEITWGKEYAQEMYDKIQASK